MVRKLCPPEIDKLQTPAQPPDAEFPRLNKLFGLSEVCSTPSSQLVRLWIRRDRATALARVNFSTKVTAEVPQKKSSIISEVSNLLSPASRLRDNQKAPLNWPAFLFPRSYVYPTRSAICHRCTTLVQCSLKSIDLRQGSLS